MNLNQFCPQRIKPKLLREQKTEALLVFIRTILEESFDENEILHIASNQDAKIIKDILVNLLKKLQQHVVNATYLQYVKFNANKNKKLYIIFNIEAPLIYYYNILSKNIINIIPPGEIWIPEQLILCLLSEWVLEQEKSTIAYPFLNDINYIDLLSIFDKTIFEVKEIDINRYQIENKVIRHMYDISNKLIIKLNKATYKLNTKRVSKRKKVKK